LTDKPWLYVACVALILILAGLLRGYHLGAWSMWVDEGMTFIRSSTGVLDDQGPMYSTAPINFWITRWVILATQPTLFWMRLVPAICGWLAVAAVMWAGHRAGGRFCSLVAGMVVALSAWHIEWSQNARHFSLMFLLATLAVTSYYNYWESGRTRWILFAAIASVLGLATHSSMAFVLVALGAYTALLVAIAPLRRQLVTRHKLVIASIYFLVIGGGYLPIVAAVSEYLAENKTAWNSPLNVAGSELYYLAVFPAVLAAAAGLIGAFQARRAHVMALCWMAVPAALPVLAAPITTSSGAYALPAVGGMSVLLGLAAADLARESSGHVRLFAAALVAAICLGGASRVYLYFGPEAGNRPPWKEAAEWLMPRLEENDLVFATEGIAMRFHIGDMRHGDWLDGWAKSRKDQRQWVFVLEGRDSLSDPATAQALEEDCEFHKVFYRNTGPKRRDIEVYECPPQRQPNRP
jgi:mannosyltransferase